MQFIDRKSKYPGRWTMKKSDGTSEIVTLIRNDEPTVDGTPLNAENLNGLKEDAEDAAAVAQESAARASKSQSDAASSAAEAKRSQTAANEYATAADKSRSDAQRASVASADSAEAAEASQKSAADSALVSQAAADRAQFIATSSDILDVIMEMLVTGRMSFGLYTSAGDTLCTSDGDTLIATGQICKC